MVSIVSWTTFASPSTLANVGSEAICVLCDNIICFTDLNTKALTYYKAESSELGLSIEALAGHNKFGLVAFSEVVLMPAVHIIQYPKLTKYAVFRTEKIITFVDICFNDYDILIALSGHPHYTVCIWNFRNGQLLVQYDTLKKSAAKSILCSFHQAPQIVQFSEWNREILVWELCYSATGANLHEVSKIELSKEFTHSNIFSMCYGDDNRLYVVDNLSNVFRLVVAQFHLELQWSIADPEEVLTNLECFRIESHKQGLLVYSQKVIYCLQRKLSEWECEWKYLVSYPPNGLHKFLSTVNGEIYATGALGNLYQFEVLDEKPKVTLVNNYNENCIDFAILKGVKEECLLQLTTSQCVNAFSLSRYIRYSRIEISQGNAIISHNFGPYVMVGTSSGKIHFLNYSNVKEPFIVASIATQNSHPVGSFHIQDKLAVYRSIYNDFHLIRADFTNNIFDKIASFEYFSDEIGINEFFLAENNRVFIFISRDSPILIPHTNRLRCYQWQPEDNKIESLELNLPNIYRDVGILTVPMKNVVEFVGIRLETYILDYLNFNTDTNTLVTVHSVKTNHLCNINGIVSSINLLTFGVDGTFLHYRSHRKSPKPYGICQVLQLKYRPRLVKKVLDCYMGKYLVYLYSQGGLKVNRVPSVGIPTVENTFIDVNPIVIEPTLVRSYYITETNEDDIKEYSPKELKARDNLLININALGQKVTNLINYDMSVMNTSKGVFKKFCLNHKWLSKLNNEAAKLCKAEHDSLEAAVIDQSRIRDWIYLKITTTNTGITFKLRAIFSHFSLENFGIRKMQDKYMQMFDMYRFYEMDFVDSEDVEAEEPQDESQEEKEVKELAPKKRRTYFKVQGMVYDHIMSDELAMQDVDVVTANGMCNQDAKIRIILTANLRSDFNKKFDEVRQIKGELMDAILATNNTLTNIYSNINCMLKLLGRPEFKPPILSIPEWEKDEIVKNIMEVHDSEVKAINRRKKKAEAKEEKHGRLLLWSGEFWARSLITMMDGVLEKLWEEEIKKDIPLPEFLTKKDPADFTLEDQKALRDYKEKCRLLEEDRKKYLRILSENEVLTTNLKTTYILKLNENVTELMITKLKYDFAIEHVRLRNFNTRTMYFKKLEWLNTINRLRADIDSLTEYIQKYSKLYEFWTQYVENIRINSENIAQRHKAVERQFRSQFLSNFPLILSIELNKLFKKRPKISHKFLNSTLICKELCMRVNSKSKPKYPFPLPKDVFEYLEGLNILDDISNMPANMESKYWDQFVRLRRQRVEMELRVKGVSLQLADGVSGMNLYNKELDNLKNSKMEAIHRLQEAQEEYLNSVQDQALELRLTMGQVELNIMGSLDKLEDCVIIHQDDINDINTLIIKAGQMKIKAMQKVAVFRRQVIYKEWEHKMVSANIAYLNNIIHVIGKCKVSIEFLNVLRNWKKTREERRKMLTTENLLETMAEKKLAGYKRQIIRINEKITQTRQQTLEMKQANKRINRQIDELKMRVGFAETNRDHLAEEKKNRLLNEKMEKIVRRSNLIETARNDYVRIMELKTILELQRLRTYPTLGPNLSPCLTYKD